MEELKQLVEIVSHLPEYVMWVLFGFLFYKLFVIGSIYSLIRFVVDKLFTFLSRPKTAEFRINGYVLTNAEATRLTYILRRAGATSGTISPYTISRLEAALSLLEKQEGK